MKQDNQANRREQPGAGYRRLTPGLRAAEALAREAKSTFTELPKRFELRDAVHILLRAGKITPALAQTMITLIEMCGTWETDGVPIIYAGNNGIADRLGLGCQRSLRARLAKLTNDHQLICHEERPSRRRGIERDPITGELIYYGISLLPLVAQLPTIQAMGAELDALFARKATAARKIKSAYQQLSRIVAAALEANLSQYAWLARLDHAEDVREAARSASDASQMEAFAETMQSALAQAEKSFDAEFGHKNAQGDALDVDNQSSNCTEDSAYPESGTPPETINKNPTDKSVHCTTSDERHRAYQPNTPSTDPGKPGCYGLENKPLAANAGRKPKSGAKRAAAQIEVIETDLQKYKVGPDELACVSQLLHACLPYAEADDPSWAGIYAAACELRSVIGLSNYAWQHAVDTLGPKGAAAAMAYATGSPGISSSPGYIRKLADIAANGGILDLGQKLRKLTRLRKSAMNAQQETLN